MSGISCRVNPDTHAKRRLWGDSGGYCGNPGCREYLFPEDLDIDFGELAHIIPAAPAGPRATPLDAKGKKERAHHSNLILLCANCHTQIDKAPAAYPVAMLHGWKKARVAEIEAVISVPKFQTREGARRPVQELLDENFAVISRYGPQEDPYSGRDSSLWFKYARATIVPNNRRILQILDANRYLLTKKEKEISTIYKLHVSQFEDRHILDDFTSGTERFPVEMHSIFSDEGE
ncbi:HNH endonuclease signature motif containing protein [Streptomyces sp. NPDC060209]|uniref:HNH endonuclease signature motif containing protein n=1 Tax=Streptomyces sp. NPDC060209 TaxID=3347073 RepID=UPI003668E099